MANLFNVIHVLLGFGLLRPSQTLFWKVLVSDLPCVDVVPPNLNKVEYIRECLDSPMRQTYSNWRCIVVDGNSDDGSWELIQEYASADVRFESIRDHIPRGLLREKRP